MEKLIKFKVIPLIILGLLFLTRCEKDKKDSGIPKDGDGNEYDTVVIGTQVWLTENLKTTKYNNGTEVRLITNGSEWSQTTLPAYCWYNNDSKYKDTYGALYNWYSGRLELLCPVGYHVPSSDEWAALANYLMNASVDVKQSFKVLPVGYRVWDGSFPEGLIGSWWISSLDGSSFKVRQDFSIGGMPKNTGYSVRCIKNLIPSKK